MGRCGSKRLNAPLLDRDQVARSPTIRSIDEFLALCDDGARWSCTLPLCVSQSHEWYWVLDSARCLPVLVGCDSSPLFEEDDNQVTRMKAWEDTRLAESYVREDVRGTFAQVLYNDFYEVMHTFHALRAGSAVIHQFATVHRWRTPEGSIRALLAGATRKASSAETSHYVTHRSKADDTEALKVVLQVRPRTSRSGPTLVAVRLVQLLSADFLGYRDDDLAAYQGDLLASPLFEDPDQLSRSLFYHTLTESPLASLGTKTARTEAVKLTDAYGGCVEATFVVDILLGYLHPMADDDCLAIPALIHLDPNASWDVIPEVNKDAGRKWFQDVGAALDHDRTKRSTTHTANQKKRQRRAAANA